MNRKKTYYRLLPLVACAFAFFIGFVVSDEVLIPSATIMEVKSTIRSVLTSSDESGGSGKSTIWSTFLAFETEEFTVPVERPGSGGGLTLADGKLIILTHEGRFFSFDDTGSIRPLSIDAPDNGFDQYDAASKSKYKHLNHAPQYFRYNDVLYFAVDGRSGLLISFTEWSADDECYGTAVARTSTPGGAADLLGADITGADWEVIFRTQPCLPLKDSFRAIEGHMAGGRLAFLPPDKVLLGSGDYHWDGIYAPRAYSQDSSNDYGKIIEIEIESGASRLVSIGNRNVQGITVSDTGEIWAVEHGPRGGDELNRIDEGANFGWPLASYGTQYNKLPLPSAMEVGSHEKFVAPTHAWLPSIGVSNVIQVLDFDTTWNGDLLVSSLSARSLYRLRIRDDRVVFAERIPVGRRIRYAHQISNEALALWTDRNSLMVLTASRELGTGLAVREIIMKLPISDQRRRRALESVAICAECHSFDRSDGESAPSLYGVFGRRVASTSYADYSKSLGALSGTWNHELLRQYLSDPIAVAPDTTMPKPGLSDDAVEDLIYTLEMLGKPE